MATLNIITADSKPDFDEWGPDNYWSCEEWIYWHGTLKKKYGAVEANSKWLTAWDSQSADEHNYNWCKYSTEFNNFLKREGIKGASNLLANSIVSATDIIENTGNAARKATKTVDFLIPVIVILVIALAATYVYKNFISKVA